MANLDHGGPDGMVWYVPVIIGIGALLKASKLPTATCVCTHVCKVSGDL